MVPRLLLTKIQKRLQDNKAIILLGPRQVGKTTLLNAIIYEYKNNHVLWDGDEADIRTMLANPTSGALKNLIGKNKLLIIDEAQRIENIGLCLKLIVDKIPDVKVIASGSSAFELANKIKEPLTGRKWEYMLFPFSFSEMVNHTSLIEEKRLLEQRLIYGYYPDVVNNPSDSASILKQLTSSYLYKDILTWERIQKPDKLEILLQALAFQVGSEVSYHELGQTCGMDKETVERYIDLLQKSFVVFRLNALSRNIRNELKKSKKIYFYDNGLRNAVINQFNPINLRNDKGQLWENFLVSERMKVLSYNNILANRYFWRTHAQQEIDYVEERKGKFYAFEFKYGKFKKKSFPSPFMKAYDIAETNYINQDNFTDFLLGE